MKQPEVLSGGSDSGGGGGGEGGSDTIPVHSTPDQQQKGIKPHSLKRPEEYIVSQCFSMTETQPLTRGSKLAYHRAPGNKSL